MTTWIVQPMNMRAPYTYGNAQILVEALDELKVPRVDCPMIPFTDEINIDCDDKVMIPYGSTNLCMKASKLGWAGLFFNEKTFNNIAWNKNRKDMLNHDAVTMTVEKAVEFFHNCSPEREFFVRPFDDMKTFAGEVTTAGSFAARMDALSHGFYSFGLGKEISISTVKNIVAEYRWFVVDRQVISGSMYRLNGHLKKKRVTGDGMIQEAQKFADQWLPHDTCVMDLALTEDGTVKVIEFNCINGTGFYDNDVLAIAKAITSRADQFL